MQISNDNLEYDILECSLVNYGYKKCYLYLLISFVKVEKYQVYMVKFNPNFKKTNKKK